MKVGVNVKSLIKSIIVVIVFFALIVVSEIESIDVEIRGMFRGFAICMWCLPLTGIVKWSWETPFKRINDYD